jgi:Serine acetyltransferase, N-terminal
VDDLHAVRERDAACVAYIQPLLFFKGFQALQAYRLAHWLWGHDRKVWFSVPGLTGNLPPVPGLLSCEIAALLRNSSTLQICLC